MKLKGKVAIVTGAGRGLGRASAIEMAKEGASVVVLSRTLSEIKDTSKEIESIGGKSIYIKADVSKDGDIKNVVDKTMSDFGRIDILMNNAAVIGPVKHIQEIEKEDWDNVININLKGIILFSKAVVTHMISQKSGKIINVTSGLGVMVMPFFSAYSITKAGLIHFTKILAEELKSYNIQVNGLDPGVMNTRMQDDMRNLGPEVLGEEIYREFLNLKERGYLQRPEKIARLAVFLSSSESDSITGKNGTDTEYMRYGFKG